MNDLIFTTNEIKGSLDEILELGGKVPIMVSGYSMRPFLEHGKDTVWVRKCTADEVTVNSILLYKRKNGNLILHRVMKHLPDDKLIMCGDAQVDCEIIDNNQILGIVYEIQKNGKRIPADSNIKLVNFWRKIRPLRPIALKLINIIRR